MHYKFLTTMLHSYGNNGEELYYAIRWAQINKRKILLLDKNPLLQKLILHYIGGYRDNPGYQFIEHHRVKKIPSYTVFLINFLVLINLLTLFFSRISSSFPKKSIYLRFGIREIFSPFENNKIDHYDQWVRVHQTPLNIKLSTPKNIHQQFERWKKTQKINNSRYVVLHVREGEFRQKNPTDYQRDSHIENYILMIDWLASRGIKTVRIGDKSMPRLNHDMLIDYAHDNSQNQHFDFLLIKESIAYIGTQSGPLDLAYLFQKPMLLTNMVSWFQAFAPKDIDRLILKKIYDKQSKQELLPFDLLNSKKYLSSINPINFSINPQKFIFNECTKEELLNATKEFFLFNPIPSSNQKEFNQQRKSFVIELIQNWKEKDFSDNICNRFLANTTRCGGYLSEENFRRKNG